jgi:hypothetical protein
MNYYLIFYLFSIADNIAHTLVGLGIAGAFILLVVTMVGQHMSCITAIMLIQNARP